MRKEHKPAEVVVDQDKFSIHLSTTHQASVEREIFSSIEEAKKRKNLKQWAEVGLVAFWGSASVSVVGQGLDRIVSGINNGDRNDIYMGVELIALGSFFLRNSIEAVRARRLAKKQLEKLQTFVK